jgi:hypothetical protein
LVLLNRSPRNQSLDCYKFCAPQPAGDSPVHERFLRRMAGEKDWRRQLKMFGELQITALDGNPGGGP